MIFDDAQKTTSLDRCGRVVILAYLVANLTRWTTHFTAFARLYELKDPLETAVFNKRGGIILAQVGAASGAEEKRLTEEATTFCDLIHNPTFWDGLEQVLSDIEPICYVTNLSQKDSTWADQVLLALMGLYLHFTRHPEPEVADAMCQRIEKRWKDCDQPLFLLSLILNPWYKFSVFGEEANMDPMTCIDLVRGVSNISSTFQACKPHNCV
jgi:hypothetical protein